MIRLLKFIASAAALVLLVVSFLGFAGSNFWIFDLFNHFRVQFLVVSLVGVAFALVLRSGALVGCYGGVGLCHLGFIAPLYFAPCDHAGERTASREISVVSYNTWARNDDWESIKPVLGRGEPSLIYLTELHPEIQTRIEELKSEFHIFQENSDAILVRRNAKLSPRLITNTEGDSLPGMVIAMGDEKMELMFLGIHPAAPLSRDATRRRDKSFAAIASFLEEVDEMVIVVGDFNATPWSRPFRCLQKRTGLVNSQRGGGFQATWPSYPGSNLNWLLRIPIDHCLHSPEIITLDRSVGVAGKSNHNPIRVNLEIPVPR
ncbi:MAG: endonuclease/exonuclease/phosphatase (EEP) superfamily protein YafD [Akkermansiaceae bacterium]|jgi:endonuclease/exonuclease/phosphatase (EEP) superfamily protein YafD